MGTTADKLNKVLQTKEAIRTAINNKGGTLSTSDKFSDYATAIDNIQSGGGDNPLQYIIDNQGGDGQPSCYYLFYKYRGTNLDSVLLKLDTSKCTNMNSMFSYCSNLQSISQLDTSSCTDMGAMFDNCSNLQSIPQLDTSNATNMGYLFSSCYSITTIPQLDTSKVTNFSHMFSNCSKLQSIPQLDTSKCTTLESAFYYCSKVPKIDITHMILGYTGSSSLLAGNCFLLTKLIIRNMDTIPPLNSNAFTNCYHFYGTANSTYNPEGLKDGRIYVPDDKVEELKVATNWSVFADIIKPLTIENGEHISKLYINNSGLSLTTPRNATIYLYEFTNTPNVSITVSNESIAQINNITTTTEKITFEVIALGEGGNATITVNVSGDYSKTLTIEVKYTPPIEYRVEQISGVTYGFNLNSNEYYESTNKTVSNSFSLCKLVFNATEKSNTLKLECINSGESSYDFGILSNIDRTLTLSSNEDTDNVYKSFKGQSSTTPVIITYPEATVGEHFIYIKYKKDGGGDNGNDSLQFKVIS